MKILKNTLLVLTACTLLGVNQTHTMSFVHESLSEKLQTLLKQNSYAVGIAAAAFVCIVARWAWNRSSITQLQNLATVRDRSNVRVPNERKQDTQTPHAPEITPGSSDARDQAIETLVGTILSLNDQEFTNIIGCLRAENEGWFYGYTKIELIKTLERSLKSTKDRTVDSPLGIIRDAFNRLASNISIVQLSLPGEKKLEQIKNLLESLMNDVLVS